MNTKVYYPAIFTKDENGYFVQFIDFKEAFTEGETIEEAFEMAKDVLYLVILDYIDNLPKPTEEYKNLDSDSFISIIELDIEEYAKSISQKTINTTVTMKEELKYIADKMNVNYSQLLQNSIRREIQKNIAISKKNIV